MFSAQTIRLQIESALADRVPSALTPSPQVVRAVSSTGIRVVDDLLFGGLPIGTLTEVIGPASSGRTSLSLSFLAEVTHAGKVCAWIDVTDALQPESAAAAGIDLARLLWVRCGVAQTLPQISSSFTLPCKYLAPPTIKKGLHGGGSGKHPRMEANGMAGAVGGFFREGTLEPRCAEAQRKIRLPSQAVEPPPPTEPSKRFSSKQRKPWPRIEQALKVTDLLLQAGGFSAIVLDMGDLVPEAVSRIPLATWFRYRAAAERSQISILLLTQYPSAKSSAGLVLRLDSGSALQGTPTLFSGINFHANLKRTRFTPTSNIIQIRKPPQRENGAGWNAHTAWAASR